MSSSNSLGCFVCSELDSIPCPNSNSNYASWKSQTEKYTILDSAASGGLSCSLVIGSKFCLKLFTFVENNIFSLWKNIPSIQSEFQSMHWSKIQAVHSTENSSDFQRSRQQSYCKQFVHASNINDKNFYILVLFN